MKNQILFKQFIDEETSTYTYILADPQTKDAIIIDSVLENTARDLSCLKEKSLNLKYILDTHVHADHITGASVLKKQTGAKIVLSASSEVQHADVLAHHEEALNFGEQSVKILHTPGHTNTCMSLYCNDMIFTGDSLLIDGCGRTDFQSGDAKTLYNSIHKHIFSLPEDTLVYPGHNYVGRLSSTVKIEKESNKRLGKNKSQEDFILIMKNLNLPPPQKINESVPANLKCGLQFENLWDEERNLPEISPEDVLKNRNQFILIDVRRDDEWLDELNHVANSKLITLGENFTSFLSTAPKDGKYAFICRSGNRSGKAVLEAQALGFKHVYNMRGGMLLWNQESLPVESK